MNIIDTIPDFWEKLKDYQLKNGFHTNVHDLRKKAKYFPANVSVSEVSFRIVGHQGYYIKIEKLKQTSQANNLVDGASSKDYTLG